MSPRFNPPPGWPTPPSDWSPPTGWQPDPSWPPMPAGWQLWVEDGAVATAIPPAVATAGVAGPRGSFLTKENAWLWGIGGGIALAIGSFLPFASGTVSASTEFGSGAASTVYNLPSPFDVTSLIWGLLLAGLAFGMKERKGMGTAALVLGIIGIIGYGFWTVFGIVGISVGSVHLNGAPNIGLILCDLGEIAVIAAAAKATSKKLS